MTSCAHWIFSAASDHACCTKGAASREPDWRSGAIPNVSADNEIIERSLSHAQAFSEIFERHVRPVGAYVRRRVPGDVVDDVLSETFLVAFRRRASFDLSVASALPWLLGIATRLIKAQRAAEARHWRAVEAESAVAPRFGSDHVASDARLDAAAALRTLAPKIAALSARDRDTLLLYAWGDLRYEEVAAALGVPVGTVRSRLNRVRRKLAPPGSGGATRLTWMASQDKEEDDGRFGRSA